MGQKGEGKKAGEMREGTHPPNRSGSRRNSHWLFQLDNELTTALVRAVVAWHDSVVPVLVQGAVKPARLGASPKVYPVGNVIASVSPTAMSWAADGVSVSVYVAVAAVYMLVPEAIREPPVIRAAAIEFMLHVTDRS